MLFRLAVLIVALDSFCLAQRAYTITDLGSLGGSYTVGGGINNLGQVTGSSDDSLGRQRAIVYTPGQALVDIGSIANNSSLGSGINSRGQVTVKDFFFGNTISQIGLLYRPPEPPLRLLLPGGANSEANAINNSGQVAGSSDFNFATSYHAFRYTPGLGLIDLDPSSPGSFGMGINNFGSVSGSVLNGANSTAVVYTQGAGRTLLGTLGGSFSNGRAINDLVQVVGDSLTSSGGNHPFLYSSGSGMRDIGVLPGAESGLAVAINNAGEVVGFSGDRAFYYTQAGGMVDLNTRIPAGSGWRLRAARAINDLGQITGEGTINGETHGYVLTPVETPLYSGASRFVPVTPCRAVDTRLAGPAVAGGSVSRFSMSSGSCSFPTSATAYSLNVTVVPRGALSYLTIWPSGRARPNVSTLNSFDGRIKANAAIIPAGLDGSVDVFATDTTEVILDVNGYFVPLTVGDNLSYYPIPSCRVADTRVGTSAIGGPNLFGGQSRTFPVLSSPCGPFSSARAYSLNFTSVPNGPLTFLTTWPTGSAQPLVSTLNALTGTITANGAIVPAGTNGSVDVFATNTSHLVIDVSGYFAPPGIPGALSFYALPPCRVADTRVAGGVMNAGETREFRAGLTACGVPSNAAAYSLNATVVPRTTLSFLALSQFGQFPNTSTLNASDGAITSNAAIVPAGPNGSFGAYVTDLTDLILDINGYFAP